MFGFRDLGALIVVGWLSLEDIPVRRVWLAQVGETQRVQRGDATGVGESQPAGRLAGEGDHQEEEADRDRAREGLLARREDWVGAAQDGEDEKGAKDLKEAGERERETQVLPEVGVVASGSSQHGERRREVYQRAEADDHSPAGVRTRARLDVYEERPRDGETVRGLTQRARAKARRPGVRGIGQARRREDRSQAEGEAAVHAVQRRRAVRADGEEQVEEEAGARPADEGPGAAGDARVGGGERAVDWRRASERRRHQLGGGAMAALAFYGRGPSLDLEGDLA